MIRRILLTLTTVAACWWFAPQAIVAIAEGVTVTAEGVILGTPATGRYFLQLRDTD